MNSKQVKQLLEQYYKGKTSLEEEQSLSNYFQKEKVPEEFLADKIQFQFYHNANKEVTAKDYIKALPYQPTKTAILTPFIKRIVGIAASFLIIVGGIYFLNQINKKNELAAQQLEQSKQAYAETKKALLLVSEKLNKGTQELHKISKIDQIKQSIIQQ